MQIIIAIYDGGYEKDLLINNNYYKYKDIGYISSLCYSPTYYDVITPKEFSVENELPEGYAENGRS